MASGQSPQIPLVENVDILHDQIRWTVGSHEEQLSIESIIFVVKRTTADEEVSYTIAGLKEHDDQSEEPFELVLIRTGSVPKAVLDRHIVSDLPSHLKAAKDNQVSVIVSTKSGTGRSLKFWQSVLEPLWNVLRQELNGHEAPNVLITEDAEAVTSFANELKLEVGKSKAAEQVVRTVVLLSGDGGVVDLLNGFDQPSSSASQPIIALLPLGTGNALFHSLHKPTYTDPGPTPLVAGLRTLVRGSVADLPVFRASFPSGSETVAPAADIISGGMLEDMPSFIGRPITHLNGAIVASYGFHASLVYESDTPAYRKYGSKRFAMVGEELLKEAHPYAARVEIRRPGSEEFEVIPRETHAYVLATMVSNLERTFTISPASKPLDVKLRLVHFEPLGGAETMKLMAAAYQGGKHVEEEVVGYDEVDEVRLTIAEENDRWRKVCVDGTIVGLPQDGTMTVSKLKKGPFRVQVDSRILDN